jgi:hypothetical protein
MVQSGFPCPMSNEACPSSSPWWGQLTDADRGVLVGLREEVWEGEDEGTCSQEETPDAD